GVVRLDGEDVRSFRPVTLARRIAVVPQETALAFDYTVLEIVLMGRYPHLSAFEVEGPHDLAVAEAALESTGTRALAERAFRSLSGGEKQRVIIASALAQTANGHGAGLLLLDEPTASLDLRYQLEIGALVTKLREERGITVLLSTHDLHFAASVCTEIVLLSNGRVLARGTPSDILTPSAVAALYGIDPALARRSLGEGGPFVRR